jgi:hypothetical protein
MLRRAAIRLRLQSTQFLKQLKFESCFFHFVKDQIRQVLIKKPLTGAVRNKDPDQSLLTAD